MKKLKIISNLIILLILIMLLVPNFCLSAENKNVEFKAVSSNDLKPVSNLEVSIYQIGNITGIGEPHFNNDINVLNIDIFNLNQTNIEDLAKYAKEHYSYKYNQSTNNEGEFSISNIEDGVYVFVQNNQLDTVKMQSVVIWTNANNAENTLIVKPKIEQISKQEKIEEPDDEVLPQTGVLNLPIPILSVGGILVFALGWYFVYINSKKKLG